MSCILLVEDDADIRYSMKLVLKEEGHEWLEAKNGKEAIEILQEMRLRYEKPCVIYLDLMMPVMNGWEFLQEANRKGLLAGIPVVLVTAVAKQDLPKGVSFISKPFDTEELLKSANANCSLGGKHV